MRVGGESRKGLGRLRRYIWLNFWVIAGSNFSLITGS